MKALSPECANQFLTSLLSDSSSTSHIDLHSSDYQPLLLELDRHHQEDWAAHMSPGLAPYSLLGLQLAALHGGNLLSPTLYPALKQAEEDSLNWIKKKFHQPNAHFTHGSTYGNLEALWKARDSDKTASRIVYASRASHYSVHKACQLLGLELILIDTDEHDRLDLDQLKVYCDKLPPKAIVLNMGTSATGIIDPLNEGIALAQQFDSWIHIDAAWGGANMFSPQFAKKFTSLQYADSITFDPHKSLYQPKPSSVLLYQNEALNTHQETNYLSEKPKHILPGSFGGELFLPLWLNLILLGEEWFSEQIQIRHEQATSFSKQLTQKGCEVITSETGIVCFQLPNQAVLSTPANDGIFSAVSIAKKRYYRAVFASTKTTAKALIKVVQPFL